MAKFKHNVGGHYFDFDTRTCTKCGMTQDEFRDKKQPACTGRKPDKREPSSAMATKK